LAYRHSLAQLRSADQQVRDGWWLLNTNDAWCFLAALESAENSSDWQRQLKAEALNFGLQGVIMKSSICGLPIHVLYDHETTVVLRGKKN